MKALAVILFLLPAMAAWGGDHYMTDMPTGPLFVPPDPAAAFKRGLDAGADAGATFKRGYEAGAAIRRAKMERRRARVEAAIPLCETVRAAILEGSETALQTCLAALLD